MMIYLSHYEIVHLEIDEKNNFIIALLKVGFISIY